MHFDADFALYRKNAVVGSRKLRNAILKSLGHPIPATPRVRRYTPVFGIAPRNRPGRPIGSFKVHTKDEQIEKIKVAVAKNRRLNPSDLEAKCRRKKLVRARQIAMYCAKHILKASYPEIGRAMGGRDHTTIMHGVAQAEKLLAKGDQQALRTLHVIRKLIPAA